MRQRGRRSRPSPTRLQKLKQPNAQAESDTGRAQAANAQAQSDAATARNDAVDAQAAAAKAQSDMAASQASSATALSAAQADADQSAQADADRHSRPRNRPNRQGGHAYPNVRAAEFLFFRLAIRRAASS